MSAAPDLAEAATLRFSSGINVKLPPGQHDHEPVTFTLRELADRLCQPKRGNKGCAGYYLAAEFKQGHRTADAAFGPAQFVMVDLDQDGWSGEDIRLELNGIAFLAHTTASHLTVTDSNPMGGTRWRVLVPIIGERLRPEEHRWLSMSLHRDFGWDEETKPAAFDKCGERLTQPIFWPTVANGEEAERFEFIDGLDGAPMSAAEMIRRVETEQDREAEKRVRIEAERERKRRARGEGGTSVIDAFNDAHDLASVLETFGYTAPKRGSGRWVTPRSRSGKPSLVILTGNDGRERVYSHRGSDEGTEWQLLDAFGLYRLHKHDGDMSAAVRAAARELGIKPLHEAKPAVKADSRGEEFKPYRVVRFADIEANLSNNDIIKGVIARQSIAVLYGPSGSTKSFCATEMGLAIASGQPWRGHRTKRGRVVYVAAEGARGMLNRLHGARMHLALGPAERVDFLLVPSTVRLVEDTPDVDRFVQTIRMEAGDGAALVIIDTLSQSMAGADENGPKDMTAAIAAAQRIRDELAAAVLIVHHSGKDVAKGARGHSSLRAATDTEMEVQQEADGLCRIRATKQKEGETGAEWLHRLEQVEIGADEDGDPVTTAIVRPIGTQEAAELTAAARSASGKHNRLTTEAVKACLDLDRMGKRERIPRNALASSGYLAFVSEQDWDVDVPVYGQKRRDVISLLVERYEGGDGSDDARRESDGDATDGAEDRKKLADKRRNAAKRRISKAIDMDALVGFGEWVWLKERERDG